MFCSSCGAKNVAESNFCRQCGRKVERPAPHPVTEEAFDRALPEEEQVTALLERAYRRRRDNDVAGAIALCHEVLAMRPDSTTAHGVLGQLYEQSGERDKAVEQYERVLALNPGSIADRVKLDDLRDGRTGAGASRGRLPGVVVVDQNGAPLRGMLAWGVGACVLLIMCGAALAIAFNRQPPTRDDAAQSAAAVGHPTEPLATGSARRGSVAVGTATAPDAASGGNARGTSLFGPQGGAPAYGLGAPMSQFATPQTGNAPTQIQYVIPPGYGPRTPVAAAPGAGARRVERPAARPERAPSDADPGAESVHLSVSDGSTGADARGVAVNVAKADDGTHGSRPGPKQGSESSGQIKVTPYRGPVDPGAATQPSSDASAMIAVGQDKLNKMDYPGAILAFRKALAGANDETAYVYLEMGQCYQAHHENRNAIAMYEKSRDEYKKLASAGRQLDRASENIRICETGIKICSSE